MDVAVGQKHGKSRLQELFRTSLLGDGLLERARATTLGLLGGAAAVGLAMIALVFNQAWPLVAGGPVPPLPSPEQGVARARAVSANADRRPAAEVVSRPGATRGDRGNGGRRTTPGNGSTQAPSDELVVVPAAPVERHGDVPPGEAPAAPAPAKPEATSSPQPQPEAAEQAPAAPSAQPPAPAPTPPATASAAPESSVPPWSSGKGHAYGRSEGSGSAAAVPDEGEESHGHGHDD